MKTIKHLSNIFLFFACVLSANAQCYVEAGNNMAVSCGGSVQLNAEPILDGVWDSIQTWTSVTFNTIYFINSNTGFVGTTTGAIYKTTDGGNTWVSKTTGATCAIMAIRFYTENTGYAVGSVGTILKTTDGGETWVSTYSNIITKNLQSLSVLDENTVIVLGKGIVLKTIDGGQNWTENTIANGMNNIYFSSFNNGYICGTSGTIIQTKDAGNTWVKKSTSISTTSMLYSVNFVSDSIGYAAGSGNSILKFSNGIASAQNLFLPMLLPTSTVKTIYFYTENYGYITGYEVGSNSAFIYKTTDGGINWIPVLFYPDKRSTCGSFIGVNTGYICGSRGLIAKLKVNIPANDTYSWTPTTGLNNPNIMNPVASPTVPTMYTVERFTNGCNTKDSVFVDNAALYVNAGPTKNIGCEGSVQLGPVVTNYKGTVKLSYKWTPSTGLNSDTIASPMASVSVPTTYTVKVSTPSGCTGLSTTTVGIVPLKVDAGANQTISCGGSVQLSASSNYSGTNKLRYKWNPSTGLSNDSIADPVCTANATTMYRVFVSSDSGCMSNDTVTVTVNPLSINTGVDQSISCGGSVQLLTTTNYNGTGKLKYKWTPATGLSSDTIASPVAAPASKTTYVVTLTGPTGCTATDNVIVSVNPLTVNVGDDISATCGAAVQLGVVSTNYTGTGLRYKWTPATGLNNDTVFNPVSSAGNINYTVTITTPSGCTASDNVAIVSTSLSKPAINYVGINEKNKNILSWTKPTSGKVNLFNVYRETNMSNTYAKIGSVPFDSASVFVDTNSNPDVQSNKYKISVVDACGSETALSDYHKTMHLSINKGINTIWNLIWEAYEGYPVLTYNIYRGTTPGNIQIIGSLSGSNTQFSDYTAPAGYVFYQIEAVSSTAASVKQYRSDIKSAVETSYSSRSNIATNKSGTDGLFDVADGSNGLSVYPNPAKNSVRVRFADAGQSDNLQLAIYNSMGQLIKTTNGFSISQPVDISALSEGLYMIVVRSDKQTGKQHVLIRR